MAALTTTALVGLGMAGLGTYQAIEAKKRQQRAQSELDSYERQNLTNAYEDMPISTRGIDYMRNENAGNTANYVSALRSGGVRSIVGGIDKVAANQNDVNANVANYLDSAYNNRNQMIAGDKVRIQGIQEARDMQNIGALNSQVQSGRQDFGTELWAQQADLAMLHEVLEDLHRK
jgi:hypothetical protein